MIRKTLLLIMVFSVSILVAYSQPTGTERYNLAVYSTGLQDGKPITAAIKSISQNTAITALTGGGTYQLIERSGEFLKQIESEQKYQISGDVADTEISEIGSSFGAQKICVISITIDGEYMYVAARIVDVKTKTSYESGDEDLDGYTGISQIRPTVQKAISKILGGGGSIATSLSGRYSNSISSGSDKTISVNGVTFKMVFVKGGSLYLGCTSGSGNCDDDERPSHNVTLSDFYIGETEVTQAMWTAVMGYNNNPSNWKGDQLPVEMVSWNDCQEFVSRLNNNASAQLPQGYRFALPTEAQWEYAARGGQKSAGGVYAGSSNLGFVGWYSDNSGDRTHYVKGKAPNELGIYDMSGNVREWCEDWYSSTFYSDNRDWTDPVNPYTGSYRVLRGGSWFNNATYCRVANRYFNSPDYRNVNYGFRLTIVRR